jgi:hypothetical protein
VHFEDVKSFFADKKCWILYGNWKMFNFLGKSSALAAVLHLTTDSEPDPIDKHG